MKNIISMKAVIAFVVISTITVATGIVLSFTDQRQIPQNLIITASIATSFIVKFVNSPKIKEFFFRKMTQKKLNLSEFFLFTKSSFLKITRRKVGVLELA